VAKLGPSVEALVPMSKLTGDLSPVAPYEFTRGNVNDDKLLVRELRTG